MHHRHCVRCHPGERLDSLLHDKLIWSFRRIFADDVDVLIDRVEHVAYVTNAPGKEVVKIGEQDQAVPSRLGILSSDPSNCDNDFIRCACVATRNELVRNLVKLRDPKSERT